MANWDVFHGDRLELERGLDTAAIRRALECGDLRDDDLVRPAGTTVAWSRLADVPELIEAATPSPELTKASPVSADLAILEQPVAPPDPSDFEVESEDFGADLADSPATLRTPDWVELRNDSDVAFPVINDAPPAPASIVHTPKDQEPVSSGGWQWAEEVEDEDDEDSEEAYRRK